MSDLRAKVRAYAAGKYNQQDGDGECWTLCENALKHAGAKTSSELTKTSNFSTADYVWGKKIKVAEAQPGDILQFRNYKLRKDYTDGGWSETQYPHHSAIVVRNGAHMGWLMVLHQNVEDGNAWKKLVVSDFIFIHDSDSQGSYSADVKGKIRAYKPIPA